MISMVRPGEGGIYDNAKVFMVGRYRDRVLRTKLTTGCLKDKERWSTIKRAGGFGHQSDIPTLIDENSRERRTAKEKLECFGNFFSQKCSLGDNDIDPSSIPRAKQHNPPATIGMIRFRTSPWRILLEKVADSARKAVKLAESYKPYGGQFLEFCSISLSTYQTCMKLTRKSTEFCQFFCRHYPPRPNSHC